MIFARMNFLKFELRQTEIAKFGWRDLLLRLPQTALLRTQMSRMGGLWQIKTTGLVKYQPILVVFSRLIFSG